jgi:hypothetical protein
VTFGRFIRRLLLLVLVVVALAVVGGAAWIATHRDQSRGWRQAIVVAAGIHDEARGARAATRVLGTEASQVQQVAGLPLPATLARPVDGDPRPSVVLLVPGGTTTGEDRSVADAQRSIASAGLVAWAVRVRDADASLADPRVLAELATMLDAVATHEATRSRHVSVIAVGPTASLVLRIAGEGAADRARIRGIVAAAPIADVQGLLRRAVTSDTPDPELRRAAGQAILRVVEDGAGTGTSPLVTRLLELADESDDPIGVLENIPLALVDAGLRPALQLLRSETPQQFDATWRTLPVELQAAAEARSPLPVASAVDARVLLVVPASDGWSQADAARLASRLSDDRTIRVDVDAMLDGNVDSGDARDLLGAVAWWLQAAGD